MLNYLKLKKKRQVAFTWHLLWIHVVLGTIVAAIGFFYVSDRRFIRDHFTGTSRTDAKMIHMENV